MKAAGPDGLKPIVLQNLDERSTEELTTIYKVCIMLGYVPEIWCKSNVVFIPKPGKSTYDNPKSYRPVSLTPFGLKALERLVTWDIEEKEQNKTHKLQFSFKKNKSTDTALSTALDRIESGLLTGKYTLGISLDIRGAYDCININSIINGLKSKQIPDIFIKWY